MEETCVPTSPQRVVTLAPDALGNTLALNVKPIASTNDFSKEGAFLPYLNSKAKGIETLGSADRPNIERLLSLQPDLIFGWGGNSLEAIYPLLSKIAPTVLYRWQDGTWKENFNFTAKVLGKQETAQAAWHHYQERIQELKTALGNCYKDKKISFIYFSFGRIGTYVKNSLPGSIFSDVDLQRPESQDIISPSGNISFSEEELEKADGDILFVASFTDSDIQFLKKIERNSLWQKLKAVQQNHVYFVNGSAWLSGYDMTAANAVIDDLSKYLVNTPNS
ncbi:MAG: iron-siderophore ABC transporter substrate-binding protein [Leptolyngbya sp. IPPAS B-1204]